MTTSSTTPAPRRQDNRDATGSGNPAKARHCQCPPSLPAEMLQQYVREPATVTERMLLTAEIWPAIPVERRRQQSEAGWSVNANIFQLLADTDRALKKKKTEK